MGIYTKCNFFYLPDYGECTIDGYNKFIERLVYVDGFLCDLDLGAGTETEGWWRKPPFYWAYPDNWRSALAPSHFVLQVGTSPTFELISLVINLDSGTDQDGWMVWDNDLGIWFDFPAGGAALGFEEFCYKYFGNLDPTKKYYVRIRPYGPIVGSASASGPSQSISASLSASLSASPSGSASESISASLSASGPSGPSDSTSLSWSLSASLSGSASVFSSASGPPTSGLFSTGPQGSLISISTLLSIDSSGSGSASMSPSASVSGSESLIEGMWYCQLVETWTPAVDCSGAPSIVSHRCKPYPFVEEVDVCLEVAPGTWVKYTVIGGPWIDQSNCAAICNL